MYVRACSTANLWFDRHDINTYFNLTNDSKRRKLQIQFIVFNVCYPEVFIAHINIQ